MTRPGHPADRKAAAELIRECRALRKPVALSRREFNEFIKIAAYNNLALMTSTRKALRAAEYASQNVEVSDE